MTGVTSTCGQVSIDATRCMSDPHKVQPIPEDYGSVTPYVIVKGVARFIDFLKEAFGAVHRGRVHNDDGTIGHAEVRIGDSVVMVFDAKEDWPETPSFLTLYVEDCDEVHRSTQEVPATLSP